MSENGLHVGKMRVHKSAIIVAGGLTAIGAYVWYTRKTSANAMATTAADTTGQDVTSADTGYSDYTDYGATDYSGYPGGSPSLYGYVDPTTGAFIGGYGNYPGSTTVTAPSTNAEWAQQAISYLEGLGYNPVTTATAIGLYLAGANLSADQLNVVRAAIGAVGNPPVAVPPPHSAPPSGHKGTPVPPGGLSRPTLKVDWTGKTQALISWNVVPGATKYYLYIHGIWMGTETQTSVHVARHSGPYTVKAVNGKVQSPASNPVTIK